MNFFEYQEDARRRTALLVAYYGLAVILIIVALYGVASLLLRYGAAAAPDGSIQWMLLWDPTLFLVVAGILAALIGGGTVYKIAALASGGDAVARLLGGRPILPSTTDIREKRLLNIVEEMAIASGTPIPKVYLLDQETGINAFAAGWSPANAVIAVTRGALDHFNRDQLQGVIAHEFSHILNGDMRLNIRLIGVLNGILVVAVLGYWMFRITARSASSGSQSSRSRKGGNPLALVALLGLAAMIIGYIGVFFARLIKSAVSRQREFLADASAVQFTRNPMGLASALRTIASLATGSRVMNPHAEEASHLFFSNGMGVSLFGLLSTHPPLEARIRRLDPDAALPAAKPAAVTVADDAASSLVPGPVPPPLPSSNAPRSVNPAGVIADVGTLHPAALDYASALLAAIPHDVASATRTPAGSQAVLLGLVMNPDNTALLNAQMDYLSTHATPAVHRETMALSASVQRLRPELKLPVAELAIGTLRHLTAGQYRPFREILFHLAGSDNMINLLEYAILRMAIRNLDPAHGLRKPPAPRQKSLTDVAPECAVLLSVVAWFGSEDRGIAATAFHRGAARLSGILLGGILPQEKASLQALDTALDRLAETVPTLRESILAAVVETVTADGFITIDEGEVLRAIADAIDCPIPPFLPGQPVSCH